ncbi:hypothetical protein VTO73DRAFT_6575 [Trametes versicolor]
MISLPQPPQTTGDDQPSPSPNPLPLHNEDDNSDDDGDDSSLPNNPFRGNPRSTNPLSDLLDNEEEEHHSYVFQLFFRAITEYALHHMTGNPAFGPPPFGPDGNPAFNPASFGPDMTGHPAFTTNTTTHTHRTVSPTPTQASSTMPTSPPRSQSSRSAASGGSDVSMASVYSSFTAALRGQERQVAKERADRKRLVKEVEQLQAEITEVKVFNAILQDQVTDMSNEVKEVSNEVKVVGGAVSHLSEEMGTGFDAIRSELSELNRGFKSMENMFSEMIKEFRLQGSGNHRN